MSSSPEVNASGGRDGAATASGPATPGTADDRRGWPAVVRVGLVPTEGGADTTLRFVPLSDCLEKRLRVKVELISASTYQGVITAMGNDQLEFAYLGPKSYIEAAKRAKAEALLVELNKEGERGYRSVFIVPAASPMQSIKDAKGKKLAFTDINSTSGYLIPTMIVLDTTGKSAEDFFSQVTFSGSHTNSLVQVAAGEVDIAAVSDLDMNKALEKGLVKSEAVRTVHSSELIPGSPMVARRDIPESLKRAFVEALMSLNSDKASLTKLQNGGYAPVTDREFDVIRASSAYLEKVQSGHGNARKTDPAPTGKP